MRAKIWTWAILTVGIAAIFVFSLRQRTANDALRAEARRVRAQHAEMESLRAEQAALKRQQGSSEEIAILQQSAVEASRLRVEAAELRRQVQHFEKADQSVVPAPAPQPAPVFATNAGRATPLATVQTAVWAAQQGDTAALTRLVAFDAAGRALIDALFAHLPEETRMANGSAEKVFATLLAVRLPQDLTSADVITATTPNGDEFALGMRLKRTGGETKEARLRFSRDAEGWRLVVPAKVVENYIATLKNRLPTRSNSSSLLASPVLVE